MLTAVYCNYHDSRMTEYSIRHDIACLEIILNVQQGLLALCSNLQNNSC